jgi:hypothetical protein
MEREGSCFHVDRLLFQTCRASYVNLTTGDHHVTSNFYRTDRTISLSTSPRAHFNVRAYTKAESAASARVESRAQSLSIFPAGSDKAILGHEYVVDVPGVTSERPPEVLVHGRWLRVHVHQAPGSNA